jgi:glycosyltransferase involved in cell wall biosynthesis
MDNLKQPIFTIATITYNSGKWIRQTIESILSSSFTDFELIISDDGSIDDTWEIIQQYKDSRIRAWQNEINITEYPNRNKVLNEARGLYILYIDGDDLLYKHTLRELFEYTNAFPDAAGIWGSSGMDFAVFPYLFTPEEITRLIFFSPYHISIVGFAESLFKISVLKKVGGFSEKYKSGDVYIKKRIACEYPVLLTNPGYAFWRTSPGQASNLLRKGYHSLIEMSLINEAIVKSDFFPLKDKEFENTLLYIRSSVMKLLIVQTLFKFRIFDFFRVLKKMSKSIKDVRWVFYKINMTYKPTVKENLLINRFHFSDLIN